MSTRYVGVAFPAGSESDPRRAELEAMLLKLRDAIGRVLEPSARRLSEEPVIVAGRRMGFARAQLEALPGRGSWVVLSSSRLVVARRWLDAGRPQDAADLLAARCDAGEIPLVLVFGDGSISLSRAALRTGDLA